MSSTAAQLQSNGSVSMMSNDAAALGTDGDNPCCCDGTAAASYYPLLDCDTGDDAGYRFLTDDPVVVARTGDTYRANSGYCYTLGDAVSDPGPSAPEGYFTSALCSDCCLCDDDAIAHLPSSVTITVTWPASIFGAGGTDSFVAFRDTVSTKCTYGFDAHPPEYPVPPATNGNIGGDLNGMGQDVTETGPCGYGVAISAANGCFYTKFKAGVPPIGTIAISGPPYSEPSPECDLGTATVVIS